MEQSKRLSFEVLESRQLLAANPIITEFVASNQSVLLDGNGATPDWIEIYNHGDQSVDLVGYGLTDDPSNLNRWEFPNQTLEAGGFLVVYASGNAMPDPAGNLHTNFSLTAGGEYLALSDPNGTVVSEFGSATTNYPALIADEAYGLAFNSSVDDVVTPTSSVRYFIPTDGSVDASWTANAFDDSTWQSGLASIGYEESPADYDDLVLTMVPLGTTSVYVRIPFTVADPNTFLDVLQMKYDDGFIAYLNGTRIASDNAPAIGVYDSTATGQHPDGLAVDYVDFDVSAYSSQLVVGSNTLAIHLLNRNSGSSDLLLAPNLKTTTGSLIVPHAEGRMLAPTPRRINSNLQASAVEFSRVGGAFVGTFQLTMTSTGSNEIIRYTTDGSLPSTNSPVHNGAITVNSTTQFRARAFGPVGQLGPVAVATYSLTEASTSSFTSDLPIVLIENFGQGVPGEEFEDATLAIYETDDVTGRSSLSNSADVTSLIGQHRRGSSTFDNPKPNLRIELRDVNGEDQSSPLLDMPAEADWILYAPYTFDRAMVRDTVVHELSRQIGRYGVRTRFVEVYANTNDGLLDSSDYLGVYVLMENIKRDDNRVDIENLNASQNTAPEVTGGYIIKMDRADGESGSSWKTSRGVPNRGGARLVHVEPERIDMTDEQVDYIRDYVQEFEDVLYSPNSTDPITGYEAYLDVEAAIDHHILRALSKEPDSFGLSTYITKDRGGKLSFGPVWDSDRAMGADVDQRSANAEGWYETTGFLEWFDWDWWGQLFEDPDFRQRWVDRWQELRRTVFSDANVQATLDRQAAEVAEAQARNFARWPEVAPNGGTYAQPGLTGWEAEVSHLSGWLITRLHWIDAQLVEAPTFGPNPGNVSAGSQVTLTANQAGADVYYTLDGSDPRADGGGIAPTAVPYTGPITINATTQIAARTMGIPTDDSGQGPDSSPWSQLVTGLYSVEVPATAASLRITELHFHPADPTSGELNDAPGTDEDDYEFVELLNVSNDTISLNGVTLGSAVEFDFATGSITSLAPGDAVLVIKNIVAFEARYGAGFPIAGEYSGKFNDSNERVVLTDQGNQVIHDFQYFDAAPWPTGADGTGPSLVVINPNGNLSDPANWRISGLGGGTPGDASALPGDFDWDADVDGRDFLAWQRSYSSEFDAQDLADWATNYGVGATSIPALTSPGDFDQDNDVDGADALTWQRGYPNVFNTQDLAIWAANYGSAANGSADLGADASAALAAEALAASQAEEDRVEFPPLTPQQQRALLRTRPGRWPRDRNDERFQGETAKANVRDAVFELVPDGFDLVSPKSFAPFTNGFSSAWLLDESESRSDSQDIEEFDDSHFDNYISIPWNNA